MPGHSGSVLHVSFLLITWTIVLVKQLRAPHSHGLSELGLKGQSPKYYLSKARFQMVLQQLELNFGFGVVYMTLFVFL